MASAPALFQKLMDIVLQRLDGVICHLDDIILTGRSEADHLDNLKKVFQRLRQHGIRVKRNKCAFMRSSVQYLGHRIDAQGLHATDDKVKAITEAPVPKNLQELRSFLGLSNYYGQFISNLSSLIHPLNDLFRPDVPWMWTKECDTAFKAGKEKIVTPYVFAHYDPNLPIRLAGDASAYGVGAVISHVMDDGTERPIAFASRTLLSSEKNYSQIEKEALSLTFGIGKFHTYLYGRKFVLVTDHKPLTTIFFSEKRNSSNGSCTSTVMGDQTLCSYIRIEFRRTHHLNADCLS